MEEANWNCPRLWSVPCNYHNVCSSPTKWKFLTILLHVTVPHWGKGWCCWGKCEVMDNTPSTVSEWGERNHYTVVAYWKQSGTLTRISITQACVPVPGHEKNLLQPLLFQCCSSLCQKGRYWERRRANFVQQQLGPRNWVLDQAPDKMVLATEQWRIPSSHLVLALVRKMKKKKKNKKQPKSWKLCLFCRNC